MQTLVGKTVPAIGMVVCENKDHFHKGVFVSYLIAIDLEGKWYMWDDPDPVLTVKMLERNAEIKPSITRTICRYCKGKGAK